MTETPLTLHDPLVMGCLTLLMGPRIASVAPFLCFSMSQVFLTGHSPVDEAAPLARKIKKLDSTSFTILRKGDANSPGLSSFFCSRDLWRSGCER